MMEKAVKFKEAVFIMPTQISNKDEDKDALPNWGNRDSDAWEKLSKIVELFVPTLEAIKVLEGQHYITQSLILLQLCLIERAVIDLTKKCKFIIFIVFIVALVFFFFFFLN